MNFIHHTKNLYSKLSCQNLIKWFNDNKHLQKRGTCGSKREPLNNTEICLRLKQAEDYYGLGTAIEKGIENFNSNYPDLNKYIRQWRLDNSMQLMKYQPNQYYERIHCENDGSPEVSRRVFAWQLFLNDIKSGGGTKFIYQNFIAEPIAGDFYMWAAGSTHLHQGVNAPQEEKYIVTGWCSYVNPEPN